MVRKRTRIHFAVILLLCMVTLSLAAPVETQCVGKVENGQYRFDLPSHITTVMSDPTCQAVWSINDVVVASTEGFIRPVTRATPETVFVNTCPDALTFQLNCPTSDGAFRGGRLVPITTTVNNSDSFAEKLQCSCPDRAEAGSQSGSSSGAHKHAVAYGWMVMVIIMWLLTF